VTVTVEWDDESRTALRVNLEGLWTWAEFRDILATAPKMLAQSKHPTDLILNLENSLHVPDGVLLRLMRLHRAGLVGDSLILLSGAPDNVFIDNLVSMAQQLNRGRGGEIRSAASLDEARAILAQRRNKNDAPL
jgi:hypothetical protein